MMFSTFDRRTVFELRNKPDLRVARTRSLSRGQSSRSVPSLVCALEVGVAMTLTEHLLLVASKVHSLGASRLLGEGGRGDLLLLGEAWSARIDR